MAHALAWTDLELLDSIGSGHSASVFRARLLRNKQNLIAGTQVAVKVYRAWVLEQAGFLERLFREVDAGRRIRHPNVLQIYGATLNSDGQPALVMALHNNGTLENELRRRREFYEPYDFAAANGLLLGIASAIAVLHKNGIVHRDVKPANILFDETGRCVLSDFGVIRSADFPEQTTTGNFLGTIRYAAPEYLFGEKYDHAVDIYSLGCIAYEVYTNCQTLGSELHWARLIRRIDRHVSSDCMAGEIDRLLLRRRLGARQTDFVSAVLQHTCCDSVSRRLSLRGFMKGVREQIWSGGFRVDGNSFVAGPVSFGDSFGTAQTAVVELTSGLEPTEWARLLELLVHFDREGWIPRRIDKTIKRLMTLGVLTKEKAYDARLPSYYVLRIAPSIWEAYTLGLFSRLQQSIPEPCG